MECCLSWKCSGYPAVRRQRCNVNAQKKAGGIILAPIHCAAYYRQGEAIKELAKLGSKINVKDDEGQTALTHAVRGGADTELIDLMLELGADMNKGSAPPLETAAGLGNEQIVRHLLLRGANPNGSTLKEFYMPLLGAVASNNVAVVQALLKAGAKVDPEKAMTSALDSAAFIGNLDIIRILLEAGANPNNKDNSGSTPLMSAVVGKKKEVVRIIVETGADVNAMSYDGTALDLAERDKLADIINLLKQAGAKRGNELPKVEREQSGTSWELKHSMVLGVDTAPWPAKEGNANLKIEISKDDYNRSFSGLLEYRINSESWLRVFGETDEDGDFQSSVEVSLAKGENIIQFRISDKWNKVFAELEGWPVNVN